MGSTDKIMIALVALEQVKRGEASLEDEVTVSKDAAAFAIVEETNQRAQAFGLEDTRFQNPKGLDTRGQYSSARDLASMARVAVACPEFREIVTTDYVTVTAKDREIELLSTDELLFTHPPATGVKMGTTPGAGSSLVATAAAEDEAYSSVILDAREDRSAASIWVLEHGFAAYDRPDLVARGEKYAEADVPYRRGERVGLVARESVEGLVDGDPEAGRKVRVFEDLPGSAHPDTTLGEGRPRCRQQGLRRRRGVGAGVVYSRGDFA